MRAQSFAPAFDEAVVVEYEPLEHPPRAQLPRRLQILELGESLLESALDLRHAGVDDLDADAARTTLTVLLKFQTDVEKVAGHLQIPPRPSDN